MWQIIVLVVLATICYRHLVDKLWSILNQSGAAESRQTFSEDMGNRTSNTRRFSSFGSSSYDDHGYAQYPPPYSAPRQPYYTPQHHQAPVTHNQYVAQSAPAPQPRRRLDRKFSRIEDNYQTLDQVTAALSRSGLESSNLIVGIDFTKSNEWTGAKSYNRKSLHNIENGQNPYEQAIAIVGKTLSAFDDDNLIPCFGFGDASTHDQDVFSFYEDGRSCDGFEEVLARYRELVPQLKLSGPTSFAPVIETAMDIVEESGGQYHVLLIIADGQVTRSVDTPLDQLSPQEKKTVDAIVKASEYPLSIVLVGVGDGPWEMMREFDDNIPARAFDNFQFVNFTEIMSSNIDASRREAEFALSALMEIPSQYQATIEQSILGHQTGRAPRRVALPPPIYGRPNSGRYSTQNSFRRNAPVYTPPYEPPARTTSSSSIYDNKVCPICITNTKDMAFGCGHQTCCECGTDLQDCPICRSPITTRIKLY